MTEKFDKQSWLKNRYEKAKLAYAAFMKFYPFTLEDLDGEQWADIAGYEGLYQVSTFGRVRSFNLRNTRILKPGLTMHGYLRATLYKDDKAKFFLISRLVAETFIPNINNKPQVDHIDGHPMNNHVSNLRWATPTENQKYAVELGLKKTGAEHHATKITDNDVIFIRDNADKLKTEYFVEKFNLSMSTVCAIQRGDTWKYTGGTIRKTNKRSRRVPNEIRNQIRDEYKTGKISSSCLAKKYGVSQGTVLNIAKEK